VKFSGQTLSPGLGLTLLKPAVICPESVRSSATLGSSEEAFRGCTLQSSFPAWLWRRWQFSLSQCGRKDQRAVHVANTARTPLDVTSGSRRKPSQSHTHTASVMSQQEPCWSLRCFRLPQPTLALSSQNAQTDWADRNTAKGSFCPTMHPGWSCTKY